MVTKSRVELIIKARGGRVEIMSIFRGECSTESGGTMKSGWETRIDGSSKGKCKVLDRD